MTFNPKIGISKIWDICKTISGLIKSFIEFLGAENWPKNLVAFLALGAGASVPVLVENYWQHNVEMEIYRLNMASINLELYELNIKIEKWLGVEVSDFPSTLIFFPKAVLRNQENCQLDPSPGNGIGLFITQEKQLDELVDLVAIISEKREIYLDVKGFASTLSFSGLSDKAKSNDCNLRAARLRGKEVSRYLRRRLRALGITVETEIWKTYTDMDQNRPYPYERERTGTSARGIHALNQAVYITISSP